METTTSLVLVVSPATTQRCDLRSESITSKRQASQNEKYYHFRGRVRPGDVGLPYLDCPELPSSLRETQDELERRGRVKIWTKRDMFAEAQKPENYWPLRPPHHRGRCRGCHESEKGWRKRQRKLYQETLRQGLDEWETAMWEHDLGRGCPICKELEDRNDDGNGEVIWGSGSRGVVPVLLNGIRTDVPKVEPTERWSHRTPDTSPIGNDFIVLDDMSDGILSAGGWDLVSDEE